MNLIRDVTKKAKKRYRTIVLPEGEEIRVIKAADKINTDRIAKIILLGNEKKIIKVAQKSGISLKGIVIINPKDSDKQEEFASEFYNLREHKGLKINEAREIILNPIYFACMLLRKDEVQGVVGGCVNTTADMVRAALQVVGLKNGRATLSSCFLMIVPDCDYGYNGAFIFADCAITPVPSARQLASIAINSAESAKLFFDIKPCVAMLSFSTNGSAKHLSVDKVKEALTIVKKRNPHILIDGEFQLDTAIIPDVAKMKAPKSKIAGNCNVLIFPDLNSGNIAYKMVQRLAKAEAYGPILQGLNKPVNDLSRGCSVRDIINVVAITAVQ